MNNHHLLDDDDLSPRRERELTLSTGTLLAIFFGLALICGLFFAFGYSLGKKSSVPQVAAAGTSDSDSSSDTFNHFNKPSAGSPAGSTPAVAMANGNSAPTVTPPAASSRTATPAPVAAQPEERESAPAPLAAQPTPRPTPVHLGTPNAPPSPSATPMPATSASGTFVVQIAAVSHREDADLLVGALRGKGYSVSARSEPQDKLLHIQVGPFATKKDADNMRARLLGDGYNAIVK